MRKTISVFLAALLAFALALPASFAGEPTTFAEAKAMAEKLDKPLLVDIYAVW